MIIPFNDPRVYVVLSTWVGISVIGILLMIIFRKRRHALAEAETKAGVARGPHEHVDQTDYFCFIGPSTFRLFLWDARKDSPTLGNKIMADYGENNPAAVVVPPGVVHGYKNIGDKNGWVFNAANRLYAGWDKKEDVDEIRHEEMDSPYVIE